MHVQETLGSTVSLHNSTSSSQVQPAGALLAVTLDTSRITHVSENVDKMLPWEPASLIRVIGISLARILGEEQAAQVQRGARAARRMPNERLARQQTSNGLEHAERMADIIIGSEVQQIMDGHMPDVEGQAHESQQASRGTS